jgi:hypothetical protein
MISISYVLNIEGANLEDLPPGGVELLQKLTTEALGKTMEPIKQGILDGSIFQKKGIKSTGKLRNKQ